MIERIWAVFFTVFVLAALLYPALDPETPDSFPLSTYPMFSRKRDKPWVHQVVGIRRGGEEVKLPPRLLGTDEIMQAVVTVKLAVYRGRARGLCREVARRAADDPEHANLRRVEVRSVRYDPVQYFTAESGPTPIGAVLRARCRVRPSTGGKAE